jgi:hypothetical protein
MGCQALGRISGLVSAADADAVGELQQFAEMVIEIVTRRSVHLLLQHLANSRFAEDEPLIGAVASGEGRIGNLDVALTSRLPLIAVGGPASLYYPEVGRRLGTRTVVPPGAATANAVGAAVGMVRTRESIDVTGDKPGRFLVHGDEDPAVLASPTAALEAAERLAVSRAREAASLMGAVDLQIETEVDSVELPHSEHYDGLVSATVTAVCTGRLE